MKKCLGCMEEYEEQYNVCPHCGFVDGTMPDKPFHISPGNVVKGMNSSYTIGKVLGSGSFGVTYIAWDNILERKVAIKEYMPSEYSTRASGNTLVEVNEDKKELFSKGMAKFLEEAKKLAKFEENGIVRIFDHFYQNDTAYIVMEYLDGITLTEYIKQSGKLSPKMAVDMLMPVMKSLETVHASGIIHRDIAPDNIMITKDGTVKLIDFGASRFASSSSSKSLTVLIKPGYSPEEQYTKNNDQGPHTDVYAIAATLYTMITGITPEDALDRKAFLAEKKKNILKPIRKFSNKIPKNIENAIYNGMNIRIEDRTPTINNFIEELTSEKPVKLRDQNIKLIDRLRWRPWQIITVVLSSIIVTTLIILLSTGKIHFDSLFEEKFVLPDGMTRVPALINKDYDKADKLIDEAQLVCVVKPKEYYNAIPKDKVYKQSLNSGMITNINNIIEIWVSDGPQLFDMPSVVGMMEETAIEKLKANSVAYEVNYEYSINAKGTVIEQSHEGGSKIAKGKIAYIKVSKGLDPDSEIEEKMVTVPDMINMDYRKAIETYGHEMQIVVEKRDWCDSYGDFEKDRIMAQDIKAGTEIKNTETVIKIIVSDGKEMYEVPDVVMRTEESAKALLESKHLKISVEYKKHETFERGMVISQSIKGGEFVKRDTSITIVVSTGKGSFVMQDVVGKDESTAKNQLSALGLNVQVSYGYSDSIASGKVISQSIKAGTDVVAGYTVSIVVSSGEKLYEVPNVVGETLESAKNKLGKNFSVKVVEEYTEVKKGNVYSQSLAVGSKYKKNTEILLVVSKGKNAYTVYFDAIGGEISNRTITVYLNEEYGTLPTCSKAGYSFVGWFTAAQYGERVYENSKYNLQADSTLYAHWVSDMYNVYFDPNGGNVEQYFIGCEFDSAYKYLPMPTRDGYRFDGWFTELNGGSKITIETIVKIPRDHTLYAHWTEYQWSGWKETKPSDESKYIIKEKTQYREQHKVTTASYSPQLPNYTLYHTEETWGEWGTWSEWSTNSISGNESREVEMQYIEPTYTTNYQYFHYCNGGGNWGTWANVYSSSYPNYHTMNIGTQLTDGPHSNQTGSGGSYYKGGVSCPNGCNRWYIGTDYKGSNPTVSIQTGGGYNLYRYRERKVICTYYFWKWSSWSEWVDGESVSDDSRNVETRKVYNYALK